MVSLPCQTSLLTQYNAHKGDIKHNVPPPLSGADLLCGSVDTTTLITQRIKDVAHLLMIFFQWIVHFVNWFHVMGAFVHMCK